MVRSHSSSAGGANAVYIKRAAKVTLLRCNAMRGLKYDRALAALKAVCALNAIYIFMLIIVHYTPREGNLLLGLHVAATSVFSAAFLPRGCLQWKLRRNHPRKFTLARESFQTGPADRVFTRRPNTSQSARQGTNSIIAKITKPARSRKNNAGARFVWPPTCPILRRFRRELWRKFRS